MQCKVRTEPKSGIPESKPEPYIANLEAPIFSVHRAALYPSIIETTRWIGLVVNVTLQDILVTGITIYVDGT